MDLLRPARRGPRLTILMYHSVCPVRRVQAHTLTPGAFARQVSFLASRYEIVRLSSAELSRASSARRRVALTFDDGFVDFREHALPALERARVPCTMFVPTAFLGLADVMSRDDVRRLHAAGLVSFGSHTVDHVRMRGLAGSEMRRQARESKASLEALLGETVESFAYPFGQRDSFSPETTAALGEAGYRLGVTSCWGSRASPDDPLTLPRIFLDEEDDERAMAAKVEGWYDWRRVKERVSHAVRRVAGA